MRLLIILLLVIVTQLLNAQKIYETQPETCHFKFIFEDEEQLIFYEPNDSVFVNELLQDVEEKKLLKLKGIILLQVMIDTADQLCCLSYTNKTNLSANKFDIPTQLKKMNGWRRIAPGYENENICSLIQIYIDKYNYTIKRQGYNRNKGRRLLLSNEYKRFANDSVYIK